MHKFTLVSPLADSHSVTIADGDGKKFSARVLQRNPSGELIVELPDKSPHWVAPAAVSTATTATAQAGAAARTFTEADVTAAVAEIERRGRLLENLNRENEALKKLNASQSAELGEFKEAFAKLPAPTPAAPAPAPAPGAAAPTVKK